MKVESALVCDDIRQETTKKFIIIGVYSDNMQVTEFPVAFRVSLWAQMYFDRKGDITVEVRILHNKKPIVGGKAVLSIADPKEIVSLPFTSMPVKIEKDGILTFQIREENERWKTVKKLPIIKLKT